MVRPDTVAVADGVGGWESTANANPALFSQLLLKFVSEEMERLALLGEKAEEYRNAQPVQVLETAFARVRDVIGSSTAVLGILRGSQLRIATLGDSGLMVVRGGTRLFRSKDQQHSFNFPFQMGSGCQTGPKDCRREVVQLHEGDVVLAASDGLFDNLFEEEILKIVDEVRGRRLASDFEPEEVCTRLVRAAAEVAQDQRAHSPFEAHATEEGMFFQGGKMDDISVVVSIVET